MRLINADALVLMIEDRLEDTRIESMRTVYEDVLAMVQSIKTERGSEYDTDIEQLLARTYFAGYQTGLREGGVSHE